jgi:hypothetical protein
VIVKVRSQIVFDDLRLIISDLNGAGLESSGEAIFPLLTITSGHQLFPEAYEKTTADSSYLVTPSFNLPITVSVTELRVLMKTLESLHSISFSFTYSSTVQY